MTSYRYFQIRSDEILNKKKKGGGGEFISPSLLYIIRNVLARKGEGRRKRFPRFACIRGGERRDEYVRKKGGGGEGTAALINHWEKRKWKGRLIFLRTTPKKPEERKKIS